MQHSAKYLIHAEIQTSGVVERSDVVGAVFGQTEGLLGEDLDLRTLQESEKIGRIDVDVGSAEGQSFGTFTVASAMDRVETAVLAASFETIDRVGPCRAECTVTEIEDVRAAKRRQVVDRATELLQAFEETAVTGDRIVEEVREQARAAEITEYAGLPAGPRVESSDALIIVEGRADVRQLLGYGIKNAIAVEGTNIPEAAAQLTRERTTTAFLDGDRGGDLILEELEQVGAVDYVAFAPDDRSVEDLTRTDVRNALERKIGYEQVTDGTTAREAFAPTEGGTVAPTDGPGDAETAPPAPDGAQPAGAHSTADEPTPDTGTDGGVTTAVPTEVSTDSEPPPTDDGGEQTKTDREPETLGGHVRAVVAGDTGRVRLLDEDLSTLEEADADAAFETIADADPCPDWVILDGAVTQRILDIAAQRGVGQVVGADTGEFVKQPTSVRVRTASDIL
jgi:DNA primase